MSFASTQSLTQVRVRSIPGHSDSMDSMIFYFFIYINQGPFDTLYLLFAYYANSNLTSIAVM